MDTEHLLRKANSPTSGIEPKLTSNESSSEINNEPLLTPASNDNELTGSSSSKNVHADDKTISSLNTDSIHNNGQGDTNTSNQDIPDSGSENHTQHNFNNLPVNSATDTGNIDLNKESTETNPEIEHEDPIPSGTGSVSKDCSALELQGWSEILPKWHSKLDTRPKYLDKLVRAGIPDPLRGEVWQLLSGAHQRPDLMDKYRIYLTEQVPSDQIILRDVHRTYPAHKNFNSDLNSSNSLIDSLYKVCKAYAVHDREVGYCQGLSFLVASLLLHMPEEQAFCVFVRIMEHYGLRTLFRNNFDELYLRFYQLEQLILDQIPELHKHFTKIGLEPFTYASQWFLTVFTAKFPLNAVFHIMDIFLLDGIDTIFQVSLGLLKLSKEELIESDFEGVFKFFRVSMPKRYMDQKNLIQLINVSMDTNLKKLNKYSKAYNTLKQKEKMLESPATRLKKENAKLTENNLRLEQENDDLARDLVASKIRLRSELDVAEDRLENLRQSLITSQNDFRNSLAIISDMEDEKVRLEVEVCQLKEVCRRELQRAETELKRNSNIINDYKTICSKLSNRINFQSDLVKKFLVDMHLILKDNRNEDAKSDCLKMYDSYTNKATDLLQALESDDIIQSEANNKKPGELSSDNLSNKSISSSESSNPITGQRQLGALIKSATNTDVTDPDKLMEHIDRLEVELAGTKLALVESKCKCQQLTHELSIYSARPN